MRAARTARKTSTTRVPVAVRHAGRAVGRAAGRSGPAFGRESSGRRSTGHPRARRTGTTPARRRSGLASTSHAWADFARRRSRARRHAVLDQALDGVSCRSAPSDADAATAAVPRTAPQRLRDAIRLALKVRRQAWNARATCARPGCVPPPRRGAPSGAARGLRGWVRPGCARVRRAPDPGVSHQDQRTCCDRRGRPGSTRRRAPQAATRTVPSVSARTRSSRSARGARTAARWRTSGPDTGPRGSGGRCR